MRVTEKGQVTIPKPIRDKLGIGPGSEVEFRDGPDGVQLLRAPLQDETQEDRYQRIRAHLESMRGTLDYGGMDGKTYVDWLRGPRDDYDSD